MMRLMIGAALAALAAPAAAAPTTWAFGSAAPGASAYTTPPATFTSNGRSVQAYGFSYADEPKPVGLTNDQYNAWLETQQSNVTLSTVLTSKPVNRDAIGLGVGGDGAQANQVDTSGLNEVLKLVFDGNYSLKSLVLSQLQPDDTLSVYGKSTGGQLTKLGYGGIGTTVRNRAGADNDLNDIVLPLTNNVLCGGDTCTITDLNTGLYREFWFTTNKLHNDGYRINSLTAEVPEPAPLALLGLGLLGLAGVRRRAKAA